jgi:uncharacterized protein (UPF0332 family)
LSKKEKQVILAKYRLEEAKECIDEAEYLFSGNKSPRSVMNRAYYGMFYAVLALIIFEKFISSKHTGQNVTNLRLYAAVLGRTIRDRPVYSSKHNSTTSLKFLWSSSNVSPWV